LKTVIKAGLLILQPITLFLWNTLPITMALVRSTPLQNEAHLAGPVSKKYVIPFVGKAFGE